MLSASGAWDVVYSPGTVLARYAPVQVPVRQQRRWFARRPASQPWSAVAPQPVVRQPEPLSVQEEQWIRSCTVAVAGDCRELRLGLLARRQAARITQAEAWTDGILDEHRLQFDPAAEATQIGVHAARIAAMRVQIGPMPLIDGDGFVYDQARSAVADEHAVLDLVLESLFKRVAALLAYADRVAELGEQLAALRVMERAAGMSQRVDALAAQMGADELAAVKLQRLAADADSVAAKISAITAELCHVLVPPQLH